MADTRPSIADKRRAFHELHKAGCLVIPNPWGKFDGLADAASGRELNAFFGK